MRFYSFEERKQTESFMQTINRTGHVLNLGQIEYERALELQVALREKRMSGDIPDTLVLLEHPPIVTIGPIWEFGQYIGPY